MTKENDVPVFLLLFYYKWYPDLPSSPPPLPPPAEDMKLNKSNQLLCSLVDEVADFIFLGLKSALEVISFFSLHAGIRKLWY